MNEDFALPHMIFILFTLFSAVMVRFVLETLSNRSYHPPFTVVMGLVGVLCGAVNKQLDDDGLWQKSVTYWSEGDASQTRAAL